jgi:hypothetical protein
MTGRIAYRLHKSVTQGTAKRAMVAGNNKMFKQNDQYHHLYDA